METEYRREIKTGTSQDCFKQVTHEARNFKTEMKTLYQKSTSATANVMGKDEQEIEILTPADPVETLRPYHKNRH